jgi:hypothetical protein
VITEITSNVRRPRIIPVRVIIDGKPVLQRPAVVYVKKSDGGKVALGDISPSAPAPAPTAYSDVVSSSDQSAAGGGVRGGGSGDTSSRGEEGEDGALSVADISLEEKKYSSSAPAPEDRPSRLTEEGRVDANADSSSLQSAEEKAEARAAAVAAAVEAATEPVSAEEVADFVTIRDFVREQISPALLDQVAEDVSGASSWARCVRL